MEQGKGGGQRAGWLWAVLVVQCPSAQHSSSPRRHEEGWGGARHVLADSQAVVDRHAQQPVLQHLRRHASRQVLATIVLPSILETRRRP